MSDRPDAARLRGTLVLTAFVGLPTLGGLVGASIAVFTTPPGGIVDWIAGAGGVMVGFGLAYAVTMFLGHSAREADPDA